MSLPGDELVKYLPKVRLTIRFERALSLMLVAGVWIGWHTNGNTYVT